MTDNKITQPVLSKSIGVSIRSIQAYTSNTQEPKLSILIKIADFFNISLDDLVFKKFSS